MRLRHQTVQGGNVLRGEFSEGREVMFGSDGSTNQKGQQAATRDRQRVERVRRQVSMAFSEGFGGREAGFVGQEVNRLRGGVLGIELERRAVVGDGVGIAQVMPSVASQQVGEDAIRLQRQGSVRVRQGGVELTQSQSRDRSVAERFNVVGSLLQSEVTIGGSVLKVSELDANGRSVVERGEVLRIGLQRGGAIGLGERELSDRLPRGGSVDEECWVARIELQSGVEVSNRRVKFLSLNSCDGSAMPESGLLRREIERARVVGNRSGQIAECSACHGSVPPGDDRIRLIGDRGREVGQRGRQVASQIIRKPTFEVHHFGVRRPDAAFVFLLFGK